VAVRVDHDYCDLLTSSLGHSNEKTCDATAKQHLISVATKNGAICIVHKYYALMTSSLGRSIEKMCNAAAEQRFISVATKSVASGLINTTLTW